MKDQGYSQIIKLTLPIVIQNLMSAAVGSADVVMLNFVGQSDIAAVSLATQYTNVLFMVLYGLGTGLTMLGAQYFGRGSNHVVEEVEGLALRFSIVSSVLFALAALLFPEGMMRIFTPDADLVRIGAGYLRYVAVAYLCWGIVEIYLSALRSIGRVVISMALNTTAFLLNIFLNAVFIFGLFGLPEMGAKGVALATSLSRLVELFLMLIVSARSKDIKFRPSLIFKKNELLMKDFIKMALPATANDILWGLAISVYSVIIGQFLGADVVAANSFASIVRNFGLVLSTGVASAGGILLGQIIGEGNMQEASESAKKLMRLTVLAGAIGGVLILLSMPFILHFARLTDAARGFLKIMLLINSYYVMGAAVNTTLIVGVFRAGGDSQFGFICDAIDMWLYAVPLGFLAAAVLKLPPMWVYFLLCTDEFVKWPWVIRHYLSGKWLKNITRDEIVMEQPASL